MLSPTFFFPSLFTEEVRPEKVDLKESTMRSIDEIFCLDDTGLAEAAGEGAAADRDDARLIPAASAALAYVAETVGTPGPGVHGFGGGGKRARPAQSRKRLFLITDVKVKLRSELVTKYNCTMAG